MVRKPPPGGPAGAALTRARTEPTRALGAPGPGSPAQRCSRGRARRWGPAPLRALEAQRGRRLARAAGPGAGLRAAIGRGLHLSAPRPPAAPPARRGVLKSTTARPGGGAGRQGAARGAPPRCLLALLTLQSGPAGAGRPTRVQRASCPSCPPALEGACFCRESPRGFHIWRLCWQRVGPRPFSEVWRRAEGWAAVSVPPVPHLLWDFCAAQVLCVCGGAGGAHVPSPSALSGPGEKLQYPGGLAVSPACPGAGPRLQSSSSRPGTPAVRTQHVVPIPALESPAGPQASEAGHSDPAAPRPWAGRCRLSPACSSGKLEERASLIRSRAVGRESSHHLRPPFALNIFTVKNTSKGVLKRKEWPCRSRSPAATDARLCQQLHHTQSSSPDQCEIWRGSLGGFAWR